VSRQVDEREWSEAERMLQTAFAPSSRGAFLEARMRRVREVDDATMDHLLRLLLRLRRIKYGLAAVSTVAGALSFGVLPVESLVYALLLHGTLAGILGFPTFAVGTLAVRRIFLQEAQRLGLSRSTALLLLTRAERRARFMSPLHRDDKRVELLTAAVHDWDEP
jgi:hypothetical protein